VVRAKEKYEYIHEIGQGEEKIRKKIIVELVEVHPFYDYKKRRKRREDQKENNS